MTSDNEIATADAYDLLMGLSRMTGSLLVADVAKVVGDLNPPEFTHAFNVKQMASKQWLLEQTHLHMGHSFSEIVILGGWHGVLSALFLHDPKFIAGTITSVDLDPSCAPVARLLNRRFAGQGRFQAITQDMYLVDYARLTLRPNTLVVNTSCEHIPDLKGWLARLSRGQQVVLQSNDYRAIPEHISCVSSADELAELAGLSQILYAGALPTRNYTRFMVMGRV